MKTKIKPDLNGAAETMLQSFYARAQYSKSKGHKFYDAKAVELGEKIDYDFSRAALVRLGLPIRARISLAPICLRIVIIIR